jgi:signal transduction histidine kinase
VTINNSCHEALKQWLNFRRQHIQELSKNKFVIGKTSELLTIEQDSSKLVSSRLTSELRDFFRPILNANEDLGVFLIAPNYISVFSMRNANTGSLNLMAVRSKDLLDKVLFNGETVLIPPIQSDVVLQSRYSNDTRHTMFLVTPIIFEGKIIAAFSLRLDTQKDFSRILELGRIGETGETYGFDISAKMVTASRFEDELKKLGNLKQDEQSIATLSVSDLTKNIKFIVSDTTSNYLTSGNNTLLKEMKDCRGQEVFCVCIWDKELNIGIITKIDKNEALKGYFFIRKTLIIIFILIFVVGFFILNIIINLRQKAENILKETNESLEVKVSERTKELQQTIKTKDKFFSILAHDLRSPFTGLLGLFELLLHDPEAIPENERNKMMLKVYNSSLHLFKLLENLLNWSRSQTKNIDLHPEKISIYELINGNIILLKEQAKNKKIELLNEISQDLFVFADRNTIDTVFRNLISNALKFTKAGGRVKISASINNGMVKIIVQDNGIGIPEETLNKLFKIDEKVSTTGTNDERGTGLGLILCKEFSELNHGKISAESKIGVGSNFIVELPYS